MLDKEYFCIKNNLNFMNGYFTEKLITEKSSICLEFFYKFFYNGLKVKDKI